MLTKPSARIKRFLGNISFVVLLNLLVKPGWVVLENVVQDRIGHEQFGTFTALLTLAAIMAGISDLGTTQLTTKRLAAAPSFFTDFFPTLLPLRAGLGVGFLVLTVAVGWVLGYRGHWLLLLAITAAGLLLTQYTLFLRGVLQAHQRFTADAVLSVLERLLLLGLVLALLPLGLSMDGFVGARTVAVLFTFLLLAGLIRRLYGRVALRPRWSQARQVLLDSLPLAFITLVYGLNERIDMLMLERLVSAREASYYAAAYRWVDAVMMYLWTVLPLFFARFAHATGRRQEQQELLWFGQRVVTVPLLLVVGFGLFRGELLFFQFKHSSPAELLRMTQCLQVLFLNVLVHAFFAIYSTLLTSTDHEKPVSWLVTGSIVLNTGLNFLLMPRYGALAGAFNTLLCAVLVSVGYVWLVPRRTGVQLPLAALSKLAVAFAGLCGGWYLLQTYAHLPWWLETAVAGIWLLALIFGLGIVRVDELKALRTRKQPAA
ncbi:oligosaccharide flippase family protein [Hymenobacter endophyticus]|uniref:Oligosaccharide flippase family protein n=1 Tax=Hymenobacter endophyticus TaxID=3076335 RepID=A0ABU3TK51_9BACT|nr:oligosaccharide flippase family protein [Hymenobacter endophyticus]MDU0371595.1 oligosaccharide flippase family protein [Hymenobacter endophyticus]